MTIATSTSTFSGFRPEAIDFLADLAANNERDWFNPRKAEYERLLKAPFEALVAALAERLEARGIPLLADPKRSIFRIYRDTRFSKDKSPYKTHLGASFPWLERSADGTTVVADAAAHGNGGYFNFQPGEMYVGGGMWMAEKPRLDAFRRAIVEDPDRVRAALEEPGFLAGLRVGHRPRAPQARAARVARRPPDGRPVPVQGRRLRPPPVRRGGAVAVPARHARRRVRSGHAGLPASSRRSARSARCESEPRSGSIGPTGRASATRAARAERVGWDSLWVDDHLLADEGDPADAKLEGWATLAALAVLTQRVRLGLLVAANTFRNPGLTAKLATTLDHLSDGRAVLGLGGGWFEREHEAFGIDFGTGFGERLDRLDEAARLIRRLLDGETVTHDGSLLLDARSRCASRAPSRRGCRSSSAAQGRPRRCGRRLRSPTSGTATGRPSGSRRSARSCASAARRSAARSTRSSGRSRSTPSCATTLAAAREAWADTARLHGLEGVVRLGRQRPRAHDRRIARRGRRPDLDRYARVGVREVIFVVPRPVRHRDDRAARRGPRGAGR